MKEGDSEPGADQPGRRFSTLLFLVAGAVVFGQKAWPCWSDGHLGPGTHADGPFHFYCELGRLSPGHFADDLVVRSNLQGLGAYEYFYASVVALVRATGLDLLTVNLLVCWAGNLLYLTGVMVLSLRLRVPPFWAAAGTLLAAQAYVLIGMSSGVAHSLAIPREVWLWPLPWFTTWFLHGRREKGFLPFFYGVLGAVYSCTYPLWAALLGLAFGLVDASMLFRRREWSGFVWLTGAAMLCGAIVALPSIATFRAVSGEASAVLDYNVISRSVYGTKGFRRLGLFTAIGLGALWWLRSRAPGTGSDDPLARLRALLLSALAVCLAYEPFQRLAPALSLLYPGRLSLVVYLASTVAVTAALAAAWPGMARGRRALVLALLAGVCLERSASLTKANRNGSLAQSPEFASFCHRVKAETSLDAMLIVPPDQDSHYFRVFAERGLWISPKDTGVLSRTRTLYAEGLRRKKTLDMMYDDATFPADRAAMLERLRDEGLDFVVTKNEEEWSPALSWPVVFEVQGWQLRCPPSP
jgi:hypothetical protein